MLQASRDKNGVYVEPWRFEQMENTLASQSNQVCQSLPCSLRVVATRGETALCLISPLVALAMDREKHVTPSVNETLPAPPRHQVSTVVTAVRSKGHAVLVVACLSLCACVCLLCSRGAMHGRVSIETRVG